VPIIENPRETLLYPRTCAPTWSQPRPSYALPSSPTRKLYPMSSQPADDTTQIVVAISQQVATVMVQQQPASDRRRARIVQWNSPDGAHVHPRLRSQWSRGKTLDCGVLGPRIEAHHGLVFMTTTTAIYSLGHGLCTLTAVPRSTQPSTFRGTVNHLCQHCVIPYDKRSLERIRGLY